MLKTPICPLIQICTKVQWLLFWPRPSAKFSFHICVIQKKRKTSTNCNSAGHKCHDSDLLLDSFWFTRVTCLPSVFTSLLLLPGHLVPDQLTPAFPLVSVLFSLLLSAEPLVTRTTEWIQMFVSSSYLSIWTFNKSEAAVSLHTHTPIWTLYISF